MLTIRSEKPTRGQSQPLNEIQRALVEKKLEILGASFGFTQDRRLHIQAEDLKSWTDECVHELRRRIAAPSPRCHVQVFGVGVSRQNEAFRERLKVAPCVVVFSWPSPPYGRWGLVNDDGPRERFSAGREQLAFDPRNGIRPVGGRPKERSAALPTFRVYPRYHRRLLLPSCSRSSRRKAPTRDSLTPWCYSHSNRWWRPAPDSTGGGARCSLSRPHAIRTRV